MTKPTFMEYIIVIAAFYGFLVLLACMSTPAEYTEDEMPINYQSISGMRSL